MNRLISARENCFIPERISKKKIGLFLIMAMLISATLLGVGAAMVPSPEVPDFVAQVNTSVFPYNLANYTIRCVTNQNTQLYCTATSFSIITGGYGLCLGLALLCFLKNHHVNGWAIIVLVLFVMGLPCIGIGLWAETIVIASEWDSLLNANLAFNVLSLLAWTLCLLLFIYSPIPVDDNYQLANTTTDH